MKENRMSLIDSFREKLPDRYVDLIIGNLDDPEDINSSHFLPIESELMSLFPWELSNEGYHFWNEVHLFLIGISDELPFIPIDVYYAPDTVLYSKKGIHIMNVGNNGMCVRFDNSSGSDMEGITAHLKDKLLGILN